MYNTTSKEASYNKQRMHNRRKKDETNALLSSKFIYFYVCMYVELQFLFAPYVCVGIGSRGIVISPGRRGYCHRIPGCRVYKGRVGQGMYCLVWNRGVQNNLQSMAWYGIVGQGLKWYGMERHVFVLFDIVWLGMVRLYMACHPSTMYRLAASTACPARHLQGGQAAHHRLNPDTCILELVDHPAPCYRIQFKWFHLISWSRCVGQEAAGGWQLSTQCHKPWYTKYPQGKTNRPLNLLTLDGAHSALDVVVKK